jgi:hypothetical protein
VTVGRFDAGRLDAGYGTFSVGTADEAGAANTTTMDTFNNDARMFPPPANQRFRIYNSTSFAEMWDVQFGIMGMQDQDPTNFMGTPTAATSYMYWSNHVLWAKSTVSTNALTPFTNGVVKNPITINTVYSNALAGLLSVNYLATNSAAVGYVLLYTNLTRATGLWRTNQFAANGTNADSFMVKLYPNERVAISNVGVAGTVSILSSEFDP